ncbi:MAG: RNA polymerase sigma factor [Dehalococcoidia bacterium]
MAKDRDPLFPTAGGGPAERTLRFPAASEYQAAFARSYEAYFSRVFAYIYSRVGNMELAKDLTAEVFEKAFTKGHSLRQPEAYTGWLFMIARNVVAGHYRNQARGQRYKDQVKELGQQWSRRDDDPPEQAIRNEALSELSAQIRQLSRRDQELLALKFDGQLTNAEIARVMGMSEVSVRVAMFRALSRLRERMKDKERPW